VVPEWGTPAIHPITDWEGEMRVTIYADGAVKNNGGPGRVGMGAVIFVGSEMECHRWGEDADPATNNLAELLAIRNAIRAVSVDPSQACLTVYSDSQWTIRSLQGLYKATCHVQLLAEIRGLLRSFLSWELCWERGHAGEQWNEAANKMAQQEAGTWKGRS
jgi:ribonuclease HI